VIPAGQGAYMTPRRPIAVCWESSLLPTGRLEFIYDSQTPSYALFIAIQGRVLKVPWHLV
jgi:hypothetical protein